MTEFISRKYGNKGYEVIIKTDSHEHYKATEDFARRLIGHAKPVTDIYDGCKWIPVTKRVPEDSVAVNLHTRSGVVGTGFYDKYTKSWVQWYSGGSLFADVTHWMPLPEAPKGD